MADKGKVNAPKANRQKPRCRPRRPASRRRLLAVVSLGRSRNIAHSHPSAAHHRPMAKRPSTQITYPLGLSARFALRSIAIERGISPHLTVLGAVLETLRRAPTPPFCRPRKPRSYCARSFSSGVLLPAAVWRGRQGHPAPPLQKPAWVGQDQRGYRLGITLSDGAGGQ